jgi:hypothetical protein
VNPAAILAERPSLVALASLFMFALRDSLSEASNYSAAVELND